MKHIVYALIILSVLILLFIKSCTQQYIAKTTMEEEPLLGKRVRIVDARAYDISGFSEKKVREITKCPDPISKNISIIVSESNLSTSRSRIPLFNRNDPSLYEKECIVIEGYICTERLFSGTGNARGVIMNCEGKNVKVYYENIEKFQ